jgi:myo-inositol-1(or 4)-monophosphatase
VDESDILKHLLAAGRQAAQFLKENSGTALEVTKKTDNSPVTRIDRESQEIIVSYLGRQFPDIPVVAEELDPQLNRAAAKSAGSSLYFVVDPLDGTASYVHGIPFYCTSVALCRGPDAVAGAIVDPNHGEEFTAIRGSGAFLNGRRIATSKQTEMQELCLNVNHIRFPQEIYERVNRNVLKKIKRFHKLGSLCLEVSYVAAGRLDGTINNDLSMWDIAAAGLIVEEAGGIWSGLNGIKPAYPVFEKMDICASNSNAVHRMLVEALG